MLNSKVLSQGLSLITGGLLTLLTLLMLFEGFAFNIPFYIAGFNAYEVNDIVGISQEDMAKVTEELVHYIDDGSGDLNITVTIDGESVQYFNTKEQVHLTDIRYLVRDARALLNTLKTAFFILLALNILLLKGMARYRFLKHTVFFAFGTLILLFILYLADFSWAFTKFHEILFYNDLWLLNPNTDRLLQMMPLEFFMRFTVFWLFSVAAMQVIYLSVYRIMKRSNQALEDQINYDQKKVSPKKRK